MIARRHIPFARPNEDSGLSVRRNDEIPLLVFKRIRCRNKSDGVGVALGSGATKNLSGFRSCGDASVGLHHNPHESGKPAGLA